MHRRIHGRGEACWSKVTRVLAEARWLTTTPLGAWTQRPSRAMGGGPRVVAYKHPLRLDVAGAVNVRMPTNGPPVFLIKSRCVDAMNDFHAFFRQAVVTHGANHRCGVQGTFQRTQEMAPHTLLARPRCSTCESDISLNGGASQTLVPTRAFSWRKHASSDSFKKTIEGLGEKRLRLRRSMGRARGPRVHGEGQRARRRSTHRPPHVHQLGQSVWAKRFQVFSEFRWAAKTGKSRIPCGGTAESRSIQHDNVPIRMKLARSSGRCSCRRCPCR